MICRVQLITKLTLVTEIIINFVGDGLLLFCSNSEGKWLLLFAGHYMLVSSSSSQTGDQVTLLLPTFTCSRPAVLTFYYHMWLNSTDSTAALTLFAQSPIGLNYQRLFLASGNKGPNWQSATVCLPAGTYRLAFVATIGLSFMSDIALDNVVVNLQRPCDSTQQQIQQPIQQGNTLRNNN
jgi:MAM domain, meprin/A5/mu